MKAIHILYSTIAPDIRVILSSTGIRRVGEAHRFDCEASGYHRLNPIITYTWIGPQSYQVGINSSTLSIQSVRLSHAGEYMCMVRINSTYLRNDLIKGANGSLNIESETNS